ncbi:MAG: cytidylate kinase-like family protein [Acidimicrobiia bacterium]
MSRVEDIDRYLRAHFAAERRPVPTPTDPRVHPFVTISRQTGIGGHALADAMLDVFESQEDVDVFEGWKVYDRSLCEIVAKDPRFSRSLDSLVEEEYRSKANDFFHQMLRSTADQSMVMNRVFLVVRAVAGMGRAIIVGRGGSHVTADMPQGISLRIVAPEDVRIARAMELHGFSEREARAGARKRDADRARLLRARFGADIDDPTGYDVTWNIRDVTFEGISEATAALVRCRATRLVQTDRSL